VKRIELDCVSNEIHLSPFRGHRRSIGGGTRNPAPFRIKSKDTGFRVRPAMKLQAAPE